jgi:hypothetical protein
MSAANTAPIVTVIQLAVCRRVIDAARGEASLRERAWKTPMFRTRRRDGTV